MKATLQGNRLTLGEPLKLSPNADFWRIFLDDGVYREITVHSYKQTPASVVTEGTRTQIRYDSLLAEDGKTYAVDFTVFVDNGEDGLVRFSFEVSPRCELRVNEVMCPYLDLAETGVSPEREELFLPDGLGRHIVNVRAHTKHFHSEYMHGDERDVSRTLTYPGGMSMGWLALELGGRTLYFANQNAKMQLSAFTYGVNPREEELSRLTLALSFYPAATAGETVSYSGGVIGLLDGSWRAASALYRAWCDESWFVPLEKPEWIRNMTGFQRIIMKHQYGEIFWRYRDLVEVYKNGAKAGLNTLLVFGWWKGCFDNSYPEYEIDPELGTSDELRAAIREINSLGGHVHLYSNGNLIDKRTDFYKNIGCDCCAIDVDGNPYEEHYRFSNEGTMLRSFGYKSFVTSCAGTEAWERQLLAIGKMKLGLGADTIFYDQFCCNFRLCFEPRHRHGARVDEDYFYRHENIKKIRGLLDSEHAIGTEWLADRVTYLMDFTHGCGTSCWYSPDAFPDLVRQTFPEFIVTNRLVHDEKPGYKKHLNYAFVEGLRYDCSIRRCRADLSCYPEYTEYLRSLIDLRDKYVEFFRDGRYESLEELGLPRGIFAASYICGERRITALTNCSDSELTLTLRGETLTLAPEEVRVIEG